MPDVQPAPEQSPGEKIATGFNNLKATIKTIETGKADAEEFTALKKDFGDLSETLQKVIGDKGEIAELRQAFDRRIDELESTIGNPTKASEVKWGAKAAAESIVKTDLYARWKSGDYRPLGELNTEGGSIKIPSIVLMRPSVKEVVLAATELGAFTEPYLDMEILMHPGRRVRVIDLITVLGLDGKQSYRGRREKEAFNYASWYTTLAADIVADAGATATFTSVDGIAIGHPMEMHTAGGIEATPDVDSVDTATKVVTFASNLTFAATSGDAVTSDVYAGVGESGTKSYQYLAGENITENLVTIPTLLGFTEQQVNTVDNLINYLQMRMRPRARQNYGRQTLYGTGSANQQLSGIMVDADVPQRLWSTTASGSNRFDAVLYAIADLDGRGYGNLAIAMHSFEWHRLMRMKNQDGDYLVNTMSGQGKAVTIENSSRGRFINGYPVVLDETMKLGDFLVADFATLSLMLDQERSSFALGYVNDQFAKNERTARLEDTLGHIVRLPKAGVKGQWDSSPA